MRPRLAAALAALALLVAVPAFADCVHNGVTVPEGTRIGGLVCQDGKWVEG